MRSSIGFAALLLANDNSKFRHAVVAGIEHAARELLDRLFKQRAFADLAHGALPQSQIISDYFQLS
jgi:hypothetical protein